MVGSGDSGTLTKAMLEMKYPNPNVVGKLLHCPSINEKDLLFKNCN